MTEPTKIDATDFPIPRGPWKKGRDITYLLETEMSEGWSTFLLTGPDGTPMPEAFQGRMVAMAVMPCLEVKMPGPLLLLALWRSIANLTGRCPTCKAKARVSSHEAKQMGGVLVHETSCPIHDEAVDEAKKGSPMTGSLPPRPRLWMVRPPELVTKERKKR